MQRKMHIGIKIKVLGRKLYWYSGAYTRRTPRTVENSKKKDYEEEQE